MIVRTYPTSTQQGEMNQQKLSQKQKPGGNISNSTDNYCYF